MQPPVSHSSHWSLQSQKLTPVSADPGPWERAHADSTSGPATGCTSRRGGTRPPSASTSRARRSSSSMVSSGGGPRRTVTTQSWQASPRTTQVSQSIRVVMVRTVAGTTDSGSVTAVDTAWFCAAAARSLRSGEGGRSDHASTGPAYVAGELAVLGDDDHHPAGRLGRDQLADHVV